MSHPVSRSRRAGYALILLTTVVGSASGAPVADVAEPSAASVPAARPPAEPAVPTVIARIPCISGTCEVRIPASTAPAPTSPPNATAPNDARR